MMETSLSLLAQVQQSDSESWNRLVELYTPILQAWLRRYEVLPSDDVDDLVQEVLLVVARELPVFEHNQQKGAFRNWLRLILVHRLRHFWRSRSHRPAATGGSDFLRRLEQLEDEASELSGHWDGEHDQLVMHNLLKSAQPQFALHVWKAFQRQVVDGAAPATVADELGMTMTAVYAAKSRVLSTLRKMADGLIS